MVSDHFTPLTHEDGSSQNKGIQMLAKMWENWALHTLLVGTNHDSATVKKQSGRSPQDINADSLADLEIPVLGITEER